MQIYTIIAISLLFTVWSHTARTGIIKVSTDLMDSGSVTALIHTTKIRNSGVLIRILSESETPMCNPYAPMARQLDFRDTQVSERDMPNSMSGVWSIADATEGVRSYSTVLSPSRLRQQFFAYEHDAASVGAVTGGAVGGVLYVCVYQRGNDVSGIEIIEDEVVPFVVRNSPDAPLIDVQAYVMSPVSFTSIPGDDGHQTVAVTMAIETRAFAAANCAIDNAGLVPHLEHIYTSKQQLVQSTNELRQIRVAGDGIDPPQFHQGKTEGGSKHNKMCDSVIVGTNDCLECAQTTVVSIPLTASEISNTASTISLISKFAYNGPMIAARDDNVAIGAREFLVKFVVPIPAFEYDNIGQNVHVRTIDDFVVSAYGARVVSDVYSDEIRTTSTRRVKSRSVDEAPTEVATAVLYDGKRSCIHLEIDGLDEFGTDARVEDKSDSKIVVTSVSIDGCDIQARDEVGMCKSRRSINLIRNGEMDDQLARFGGGTINVQGGKTDICFMSDVGLGDSVINVEWQVYDATAYDSIIINNRNARGIPERATLGNTQPHTPMARDYPFEDDFEGFHDHDHDHMPEWCSHFHNCMGIVVIHSTITCGLQEVYDPVVGRCIGYDTHHARHTASWLFFPILLVIGLFVFVGFVLFLGYHDSAGHEKTTHTY